MKYIVFYCDFIGGNTWQSFDTLQEAVRFSQQEGGLIVKTIELTKKEQKG